MTDLSVNINGVRLKNPLILASGIFLPQLYESRIDLRHFGALVTKTVLERPRQGNPSPWLYETSLWTLNSFGLPSEGVTSFLEHTLPNYQQTYTSPIVVSIGAQTIESYSRLASMFHGTDIHALEVNISCPNITDYKYSFATSPEHTEKVVQSIRDRTDHPLWVKLNPNTDRIVEVAQAAESAGAHALVVANTILAMSLDTSTARSRLGTRMGGLSGPAVKPIILRLVYECVQATSLPVIGCGGVQSTDDVVEYLLAGAIAVQIGTATLQNPTVTLDILQGLQHHFDVHHPQELTPL